MVGVGAVGKLCTVVVVMATERNSACINKTRVNRLSVATGGDQSKLHHSTDHFSILYLNS